MTKVTPHWPGMTFEPRERAIGMLTRGILTRDVTLCFKHHKSTISQLLDRFQQTWKVADRPRSGIPRKQRRWKTVFSRLLLAAKDFLIVKS